MSIWQKLFGTRGGKEETSGATTSGGKPESQKRPFSDWSTGRLESALASDASGDSLMVYSSSALSKMREELRYRKENAVVQGGVSCVEHPQAPAARSANRDSDLLSEFDALKEVSQLGNFLKLHPESELASFIDVFPFNELHLDHGAIQKDFRNSTRFEMILHLGNILLRYDEYLADPRWKGLLPASLNASALSGKLIPRLTNFIEGQAGVDIAMSLRTALYDFAMDLIRIDKNREAMLCLAVSRPSPREDHDFWLCACYHNVGKMEKDLQAVRDGIALAEELLSGGSKAPAAVVQKLRQMDILGKLHAMEAEFSEEPSMASADADATQAMPDSAAQKEEPAVSSPPDEDGLTCTGHDAAIPSAAAERVNEYPLSHEDVDALIVQHLEGVELSSQREKDIVDRELETVFGLVEDEELLEELLEHYLADETFSPEQIAAVLNIRRVRRKQKTVEKGGSLGQVDSKYRPLAAAVKNWWREEAKEWWSSSGRTEACCDAEGERLAQGNGYKTGRRLICENCANRRLTKHVQWEQAVRDLDKWLGPGVPAHLQRQAEELWDAPKAATAAKFTMRIGSVFSSGGGLMVAGTPQGSVPNTGDTVEIVGSGGIQKAKIVDTTSMGNRIAYVLSGIEEGSVKQGDVLSTPDILQNDVPSTPDILQNTVEEFIGATGAKTPTPGGGSVAGVVGALGVALGQMTLNFSKGKKSLAEHEPYYAELEQRLETARGTLVALVSADIAAYQAYQQANRLPDGDDKTRAVEEATVTAIDVPRRTTQTALALLVDMKELAGKCNKWLITDLLAAGALAVAAATLSDYNVRINLPNLTDRARADDIGKASRDDLARARAIHAETEEATREMLP